MSNTVWDEVLDEEIVPFEIEEEEELPSPDLSSLMTLGYLSDSFELYGHTIHIKTLKMKEELNVSLIVDKWKATDEAGRSYATAVVAACIDSIDGKPLVRGLGPSDETLERKFQHLIDNYYWNVIQEIYAQHQILAKRVELALKELKKN